MPGRTINGLGARRKRSRSRHNDDDVPEVRGASSRLQNDSRKRARVSGSKLAADRRASGRHARVRPQSADESDSSVDEMEDNDASPGSPPKTQYEMKRDNDFRHLENEDVDDQRATQRFQDTERLRSLTDRLGDNHVADNGILEKLECWNFMCHEHLTVPLGPLLNFIVGENGSGKSAILTAITLCLGGKASSTNRGGSLKSFVKEGTEKSVLNVTIKNQGESAYKHDFYGDSIVVERHFVKHGTSSGFKIRSATGQVISTKRQEVDDIVEYYALQVDNPLNVLSQDNARQFLNASSKAQKYKFFIEGIQLQQLDTDYRVIQERIEVIETKQPELEQVKKDAKSQWDKALRVKESLEGNKSLRLQQKVLTGQVAWVQVRDQEAELARREQALADFDANITEAKQLTLDKTEELQKADEGIQRAEQSVAAAAEHSSQFEEKVNIAKERNDRLQAEAKNLHHQQRELQSRLAQATKDVKDNQSKLEAEEKRLEETGGAAHVRKQEELAAAQSEESSVKERVDENKAAMPIAMRDLDAAKAAFHRVAQAVDAKRDELGGVESSIESLQKKSRGRYDAYDAKIPELLERLARDQRFERKPIGPLGAHIQLLQPRWSRILEHILNSNLNAFVVVSKRDQNMLKSMMDDLRIKGCSILIAKTGPPISPREPPNEFDTILRVLKFDDDLIRDQLIIISAIEQIILIAERHEAENVMFGAPPRNVKSCLAMHDGLKGQGLRISNNSGNLSTQPIKTRTDQRPRMRGTDDSSELDQLKENAQHLQGELRHLNTEKRELDEAQRRLEKEYAQRRNSAQTLKDDLRKVQARISRIQEELDAFDGNDDVLRERQRSLDQAKESCETYGAQYGEVSILKKKKKEETGAACTEYMAMKNQGKVLKDKLNAAQEKLSGIEAARRLTLQEKNSAFASLAVLGENRDGLQASKDRQVDRVQQFFTEATACCAQRPEILAEDTEQGLGRKLEAVLKQIDQNQARCGMTDEAAREFIHESKRNLQRATDDLSQTKAVVSRLSTSLDRRLQRWRLFQRLISAAARTSFTYLLTERGFRGNLKIDHRLKTLDVSVEPDKAEKRLSGRTTKTLSGGEKSFSSICLLLAIWEAMGSPLRCLDEFDVFMDNVNRAISTDMLINTARRSVNRQYIFITPNAVEGKRGLDKDVTIHRMRDPRQRALELNGA